MNREQTEQAISAEEKARIMLDLMGVPDAFAYSSSNLVWLANLIADTGWEPPEPEPRSGWVHVDNLRKGFGADDSQAPGENYIKVREVIE